MSLCILHIHLLVTISDMVISILRLSVSLILILVYSIIRQIRCYYGLRSHFESLIYRNYVMPLVCIKCLHFLFFSFSISHIASILVCL